MADVMSRRFVRNTFIRDQEKVQRAEGNSGTLSRRTTTTKKKKGKNTCKAGLYTKQQHRRPAREKKKSNKQGKKATKARHTFFGLLRPSLERQQQVRVQLEPQRGDALRDASGRAPLERLRVRQPSQSRGGLSGEHHHARIDRNLWGRVFALRLVFWRSFVAVGGKAAGEEGSGRLRFLEGWLLEVPGARAEEGS